MRSRRKVAGLSLAAAVAVAFLAVKLCWPGIHADLPLSAREVRRFTTVDIVGHYGSYGHARLSDDAFETFVTDEGLTAGATFGEREAMYAPSWFRPDESWRGYTDARMDGPATVEHGCWYRVWRRGDEVYFTGGCSWM